MIRFFLGTLALMVGVATVILASAFDDGPLHKHPSK